MKATSPNAKALRLFGFFALIAFAIVIWPVTLGVFCVWVMAMLSYGAGKASRHRHIF
jgi:hypothetical protein